MQIRSTLPSRRASRKPQDRAFARSQVALAVAAALGVGAQAPAFAGPTGGVVVEGQGAISTPNAGTTVIDQSSQRLDLNWDSFNVGASESVKFNQPSSGAVAVNRILDQNPSQIFGRLEANGKVVLVNPNGLLIGRTAQLNVGSLIASSLEAIDFDAAGGGYRFSTSRSEPGAVINEGSINAAAGSVTLLGGRVTHTGSIVADFGTVNLAAGRAATIDLAGDGLLRLEVGSELVSSSSGSGSAVENSGTIQANGGRVLLTASAVENVFTNLVNNTGVVRANRIDNTGGVIQLIGPEGTVISSGTLDASAGDSVSTGGSVEVLGDRVGLIGNAVVDVSGATGGGAALIGGDYQGSNPDILNAKRTVVSEGSTINADAGTQGDGGRIIIWAEGSTRYDGSLSARGGSLAGNGGFAEVSGKQRLDFNGTALLSAPHGTWGTLLLDPADITIVAGVAEPNDLHNGGDAQYLYTDDSGQPVNIGSDTIEQLLTTTGNVLLQADSSITQLVGADIDVRGVTGAAGRSLTLETGGSGFVNLNGRIYTNNGEVNVSADTITMASGASIDAGSANVVLGASSNLTVSDIYSSGEVWLNATTILDDGNFGTWVRGNEVNLIGLSAVGTSAASGALGINTNRLYVFSDGEVFVREQDGLELTQIAADSLTLSSVTGDIMIQDLAIDLDVALDAMGGRILDSGLSIGLGGVNGNANLHALHGIGHITDYAQRTGSPVRAINGGGLTARVDNGAGDINLLLDTGALDANSIRLGMGFGASGRVLLQMNSNMDTSLWNADAISLGAGNTASLTLSAGIFGQPDRLLIWNSNGVTDFRPGELILRGSDILDGDGTPHVFSLDAGVLRFAATGAGQAKTLNTTVNQLNATLGVPRNLTVNQNGDLTLGHVTGFNSLNLTVTGGAIFNDMALGIGNTATRLQGTSATLSGLTLGMDFNPLDTDVSQLTAISDGNVYVREVGDVTINNSSAGGSFDVRTVDGAMSVQNIDAQGVWLETAGVVGRNLSLNGVIDANGGDVRLISGGGTDGGNVINASGNMEIHADELWVEGASIGMVGPAFETNVSTLISRSHGGGTNLEEANDLTIIDSFAFGPGPLNIRTVDGAMTVHSASGDEVSLRTFGAGKGLILAGPVSSSNRVTLIADDGAIIVAPGGSVSSDRLIVDGRSIGSQSQRLRTHTNTLESATASNGGIYIQEQNGLVVDAASATGGDVDIVTTAGSLSVDTVSGNNISLVANGAGSDLTFGTLGVQPGGNILLSATNQLIRTNLSTISADSLTLRSGASIGNFGGSWATDVDLLDVATAAGGAYLENANDLTLTASVTGGALNVRTANGALDVTSATATDGVELMTMGTDHDLTIHGLVDGGSQAAVLISSGAVRGGNNLHEVGGTSVLINADSVGTSSQRLRTNTPHLRADSFAGDIYIQEVDDLMITNSSAIGGRFDVVTGGGQLRAFTTSGENVTLAANGANASILIDGNIDGGVGGTVTLTSSGSIGQGTVGGKILGGTLLATGTSIGESTLALATGVDNLDTSSTNGGTFILEDDAVSLNATALNGGVSVETINGALTASVSRIGTGGGVRLVAGGTNSDLIVDGPIDGGDGNVVLLSGAAGDVSLDGSVTTTGNVTIAAGTEFDSGTLSITGGSIITGDNVDLAAASVGADGAAIRTTASSLSIFAAENGDIYVQETDDVTLNAIGSGVVNVETIDGSLTVDGATGSGVTLTSGGAGNGIAVRGPISASGWVELNAEGAVSAMGSSGITADSLTVVAGSIGTQTHRLYTSVTSADATATNGGIFLTETDALALTANATGGAVDVLTMGGTLSVTSAAGDGVTLNVIGAGQDLALNGTVDGRAGAVSLTANGSIVAAPGAHITADSLVAAAGVSVGSANARLNTTVSSLVGQSVGGGFYVTETDDLTLMASSLGGVLDVRTADGALSVTSANGNGVTLAANGVGKALSINGMVNSLGGDISLQANGANSEIQLAGSVVTPGNVSMVAGTSGARGAIVTSESSGVIANALTMEGASIGSSTTRLFTAVTSLDATATKGGIFVSEVDGLASVNVNASGGDAGDIEVLTATGDLSVHNVNASDTALLAAGGNIIALPSSTGITARAAELRAGATAAGQIGASGTPLSLTLAAGDTLRTYSNGTPVIARSTGVTGTLSQFDAPSEDAVRVGYGQFTGRNSTSLDAPPPPDPTDPTDPPSPPSPPNPVDPADFLVSAILNEPSTTQGVFHTPGTPADPEVRLLEVDERMPPLCLPPDQRRDRSTGSGC